MGKDLLIVNDYTFYCQRRFSNTNNWTCTRNSTCKARLTTDKFKTILLKWARSYVGKDLLIINDYTFYCQRRLTRTIHWNCTRNATCKARLITDKEKSIILKFVKNRRGQKLIIAAGYTFYCLRQQVNTDYWWCTSGTSCKARIITTKTGELVRLSLNHNHKTPNFFVRDGVLHQVQFIRNSAGKMLALVNGYTYYCHMRNGSKSKKVFWRCTRGGKLTWVQHRNGKVAVIVNGFTYYCNKQGHKTDIWRCTNGSNCRARFTMSKTDWRIIRGRLEHDHKPPNYVVQDVRWVVKSNGKKTALIGGYSFYKHKMCARTETWRCSVGSKVCKARFTANKKGIVVRSYLEHTHVPRSFVTHDGVMHVKL
ncbi:unnamed protein product [Chilo suppressalis]|uniref:FLYWCH-type domain-containing protein n=1 Tax=Chilo suppressalis TaxID=168631 RepID=A0ABN8AT77_CHISP|nr:unnamed protein product [Chilo suppressalis]